MAELQGVRNGALFRVHGLVRPIVLDTADIVREAICRQQADGFRLADIRQLTCQ